MSNTMSQPHDSCPSCLELQNIIDQKEEYIKKILPPTNFSLSAKQEKVAKKFHKKCQKTGATITYSFTPTGIGDTIKIKCSCGEEKDITEYEHW